MRFLVVNDDGIDALGIEILVRSLMRYGEVVAFGPDVEHSGMSHAMTFFRGLKAEKVERDYPAYRVHGTPGDCTRLALSLSKDYDIVFSGINDGFNIGNDIVYSGTVSAASEAILHGFNSIAISTHRGNIKPTKDVIDDTIDYLLELVKRFGNEQYLLNVNFPHDLANIKGYKVTRMGLFIDRTEVDMVEGAYRYKMYNLAYNDADEDVDFVAQKNGYISITPLMLDKTNYPQQKIIEDFINEKKN